MTETKSGSSGMTLDEFECGHNLAFEMAKSKNLVHLENGFEFVSKLVRLARAAKAYVAAKPEHAYVTWKDLHAAMEDLDG